LGNAVADIDSTYLTFSWNDDLRLDLDYRCGENEKYRLFPKEEENFYLRLPEPPNEGAFAITIITIYDGYVKVEEIPVHVRRGYFN
jgi:hypothetical protein